MQRSVCAPICWTCKNSCATWGRGGPEDLLSAVIAPALCDDALLADIREACRDDGQIRLWWLGQSGFLLQWGNQHLLLDPYLSDSLTAKYAGTDQPHVRMTAKAVDPRSEEHTSELQSLRH